MNDSKPPDIPRPRPVDYSPQAKIDSRPRLSVRRSSLRWLRPHWLLGVVVGALPLLLFFLLFPPRTLSCPPPRVRCAMNLHGISKCVFLYQADHGGADPLGPWALLPEEYIVPGFCVCPKARTPAAAPPASGIWTPADLEGHCDYVLVSGFYGGASAELVLAFELCGNHDNEGCNVSYQGGQVQWQDDLDAWRADLSRTNEALARLREGKP